MKSLNEFVAYEYKEISVKRGSIDLYADCLSNFGWELVDNYKAGTGVQVHNIDAERVSHISNEDIMILKFKRDSKLKNKKDFNLLERQCEQALENIRKLENRKSAYTVGSALGIGIIGAVVVALAGVSFLAGNILLGAALAIAGLAGCGIGFYANIKVGQRKQNEFEPLIQEQYNMVHGICEKANNLLFREHVVPGNP